MIKNSFIFTFFELLNKAVPFLLIPIFTRYLAPEDYGIIASFAAFISFLGIFIGLSGNGAVDANYYRLEREELSKYIANVLLVLVATTLLALIIILFTSDVIVQKLNIPIKWQVAALLVVLSQFITLVNLSLWVIEQKPIYYGVYQFSQTLVISLISVILIVGFLFNWEGSLIATFIGSTIFAFISLIVLYKRGYLKIKVEKEYIDDFLKFGLPMIPHQFGGWLRTQGDKIVVLTIIGTTATGLFAVGQQIGFVMSIFMSSLNKALYPILFRRLSSELNCEGKKSLVKVTYVIAFCIFILGMLLIIAMEFIYPYFLGKEFQNSLLLTQLIIISFIFDGFYYLVANYLFYYKKTAKLAKVTFMISVLHIFLSMAFVILLGTIGVGYALIISGLLQVVFVWRLSNQIYPMPWFSFWRKNEI